MLHLLLGRRKPSGTDRQTLLAATPVRNNLVRETRTDAGVLRLTAPIAPTLLKRLFGTAAQHKTFELDELGASVWSAVDGRASVERIITGFAQTHRVNLREAEVAVLAFLRMLAGRKLIALASPDERISRSAEKRRERQARQRRKKG